MKSLGSTGELQGELLVLSQVGADRTIGGAVKCVDIDGNASGDGGRLGLY